MSAKFIGYQRIKGDKSKKTGQPYDFTNLYCLDDSNAGCVGSEPVTISVTTEELDVHTSKDFFHLNELLNKEIVFTFGLAYGKPRINGFIPKDNGGK